MTASALLRDLRGRGLRVWHHGTALRVAPRALLVASDRAAITLHKPALLVLLADLEVLERDGTAVRLRAIAATLTAEEHQRLAAEAAAGERVAALMVAVLAPPRAPVAVLRCPCGGIAWEADPGGMRERCTDCGAWSPCSVVVPEVL